MQKSITKSFLSRPITETDCSDSIQRYSTLYYGIYQSREHEKTTFSPLWDLTTNNRVIRTSGDSSKPTYGQNLIVSAEQILKSESKPLTGSTAVLDKVEESSTSLKVISKNMWKNNHGLELSGKMEAIIVMSTELCRHNPVKEDTVTRLTVHKNKEKALVLDITYQ